MSTRVNHRVIANSDWNIWKNDDGTYNNDQVKLAILQDIRAELRQLNRVFACARFQAVPTKLDEIVKNTRRRKKRPVKAKPQLRVVSR